MKTLACCLLRYWTIAVGVVMLSAALLSQAHEIPDDVRLSSWARTEGSQFVVMIRAPLSAMREADLPLQGVYLDLARAGPALEVAARLWFVDRVRIQADGQRLDSPQLTHVRVSLPSDRSFDTFEQAHALLTQAPALKARDLVWSQQYLDARLVFSLPTPAARIAIDFDAARLGGRVSHDMRYTTTSGAVRLLPLHGDTGMVALDPGPWESVRRFALDGWQHILSGADHLLFVLCLMLGIQGLRALVWTITGFTLAHSVTLMLAITDLYPQGLWFVPTVEWAIAASIVLASLDVLLAPQRPHRGWMASLFGLIHGLGFSFALKEALPFAGEHTVLALASFNLGVEAGQLGVLLVLWPVLQRLRRLPHAASIHVVVCALVAHTAWHWMSDRWQAVDKFLQTVDGSQAVGLIMNSPIAWLLIAMAAIWGLRRSLRQHADHPP